MKKLLMASLVFGLISMACSASAQPAYGLSGQLVTPPASHTQTQTDRLLRQQAHSGAPDKSELPASIYVDTQKRIADTFKQAIPDKLESDTTDVKQ